MPPNNFPLVFCYLTDKNGNIISPYQPNAVDFSEASCPNNRAAIKVKSPAGDATTKQLVAISIKGFVAVCSDAGILSVPLPFCIVKYLFLCAPNGSDLCFALNCFTCRAVPVFSKGQNRADHIKITINIDATVYAKAKTCFMVPILDNSQEIFDQIYISADRVYDSVRFHSKACLLHSNILRYTEIYQYNAISDGHQRIYTNADEQKTYGHRGILSPQEVSYYNLFINGVLQPKTNYVLTKGRLELKTTDLPLRGQVVMITFVTFINLDNKIQQVTNLLYNAVSDGVKRVFTDEDMIKEYGSDGIPAPCKVSYYNLYINGVLQPKINYTVKKGALRLNTEDIPLKGQIITLESLIIKVPCSGVIKVKTYQYNAYSKAKKIFTNKDGIPEYDDAQIINPAYSSYQNLFVNSIIQPEISYFVDKGCICLKTEDTPIEKAPVSLQYVNENSEFPFGDCLVSNLALSKWNEQHNTKEPRSD
ncbi:DUF4183 domain-containing protein [Oscillospiraceae bacterium LTW-04]|nr:DUF4183 domain-containing protein [Oscillospiraceae bacterium MB24-C1]